MSLEPGKVIAHYTVGEKIGTGGMGEVYRATDGKLGRDVAIKVLPGEVAADPDRLARFKREAQLLASLNHPNIAAIYGIEESGGTPILVLELVKGQDLAARLAAGPVPADEALGMALQIAEGLEDAHEHGIVHRDLKNIALATLTALTLVAPCHAIVVRGQAPAGRVLVDPAGYPEVVPLLGGRAVGTLIDPEWILTAAHVGEGLEREGAPRGVPVGGGERAIVEIVLHPAWAEEKLGQPGVIDLALLRLDAPARGVAVAPLYEGSDETGAVVTIAGWGRTGDGVERELVRDGKFRIGENRITESSPRLRFEFDSPDSGKAEPLEAVSGPGDSGGPAFIIENGIRYLAGVSSFQQDLEAPGLYGVTENYERVSRHVAWVRDVVRGHTGP